MKRCIWLGLVVVTCISGSMRIGAKPIKEKISPLYTKETIRVVMQKVESKGEVEVGFKSLEETMKSAQDIPMLQVTGNLPSVKIMGNPKATKRINKFYEEQLKRFDAQKQVDFKTAQEDYKLKQEDEKQYWQGYGLGMAYTLQRTDDRIISFVEDDYEYTGGAHPNSVRFGQNFSTETGKLLTLSDVLTDEAKAKEVIHQFILEKLESPTYKDYLFDDYKEHIDEILQENTWYLSKEGLVIIVNEYTVTPHAVGIFEVIIPYESFPYIKEAYMLNK